MIHNKNWSLLWWFISLLLSHTLILIMDKLFHLPLYKDFQCQAFCRSCLPVIKQGEEPTFLTGRKAADLSDDTCRAKHLQTHCQVSTNKNFWKHYLNSNRALALNIMTLYVTLFCLMFRTQVCIIVTIKINGWIKYNLFNLPDNDNNRQFFKILSLDAASFSAR